MHITSVRDLVYTVQPDDYRLVSDFVSIFGVEVCEGDKSDESIKALHYNNKLSTVRTKFLFLFYIRKKCYTEMYRNHSTSPY
jgi:hypothetical protein